LSTADQAAWSRRGKAISVPVMVATRLSASPRSA
jgi:hypothetical protein